MSQSKPDYQKNQEFGPRSGLYGNLEIALPFFGFASSFVHTILQQQLDNAIGIHQDRAKEEDAIEKLKRELSIAKELGDRAAEGRANRNLGISYLDRRNFDEAIKYHEQELTIAKEVSNRDGEKQACACLGIAYRGRGNLNKSIEYHERELSLAKEAGDRAGELCATENLGITYRNLRDLNKAIDFHKQMLEIAEEVSDRAGEGRAHGNLGISYLDQRDFKEAIKHHKRELEIAQTVKDRTGEGRAVGNLGVAYRSRGDFKKAINLHRRELKIAEDAEDKAAEGRAYGNLGTAYRSFGDLNEAIKNHLNELRISQEVGDKAAEGSARGNLGNAYHKAGRLDDAITNYEKSLEIAKEVENKVGKGSVLCHLGSVYDSRGDYQNAIKCCEKALEIAEEENDNACKALANGNLGNAFANLGDFATAKMYHREQLRFGTDHEIENKYIQVRAYCNLGKDYRNIPGSFAKGIECDKKGLKIAMEEKDRHGELLANKNLGTAYLRVADFEEAKKYHNEHLKIAQELGDRKEEGRAYVNLGDVYRGLNDFQRAEVFHKQGLAVSKDVEDKVGKGRALYSLGRDSESVGSLREALEYHRECVKLYNDMRESQCEDQSKIYFRDQHKDAYTALWETLIKLQMTDQALYEAEKARAQDLNDLLNLRFGFKGPKGPEESSLSNLPFGYKVPGGTQQISHIVRNIRTQTVFLALGSNKINFWVFRKGDQIRFRQKERDVGDAFQNLIKNAYTAIEADDSDVESKDKRTALSMLYDAIIGPIEDLLDFKGEELIIIPDGPLYFVPYAALLNHEEPAAKYLGECIRVRIFPSLASLKIIVDDEDHHSKTGALLVGNPTNSLEYAEKEVREIARIIDTQVHLLTNQRATKMAVKDKIKSVALVHFAAHGKINGEIELAEENVLTMQDVQDVTLTARLVVLSCCDTGRGALSAEGVIGIARAFLCAGARSVLASLWSIDDDSTMKFMTQFYGYLKNGKSASVALQLAMKDLRDLLKQDLRKKAHAEKYWAPFVLIGDDVTLAFGESK